MKIADIRKLTTEQLTAKVTEARQEIVDLRRSIHLGEVQNNRIVRQKRRELARFLTVLSEQLMKEAK